MDLGLSGSRALVTGSSRGIGLGIASAFVAEGATVVLTGRNVETLERARDSLARKADKALVETIPGDLGNKSTRERLKMEMLRRGLDHVVCNVGSGQSVPILRETPEEWQRMLDINLLQSADIVLDLLPLLKDSAQGNRGPSVTFVGSICGNEAIGCPLAYAAAKAALRAYAKNLARPLAREGIRVNMASPGNILFPGSSWEEKLVRDREAVQAMLEREVPMKRLGTVEEIAAAVVFLASRQASFITGAELVIDGGQTRGL